MLSEPMPGYVYKWIDPQWGGHLAWHPWYRWTQYDRGYAFTYWETRAFMLRRSGDPAQRGVNVPGHGRWFKIGKVIPLYDEGEITL